MVKGREFRGWDRLSSIKVGCLKTLVWWKVISLPAGGKRLPGEKMKGVVKAGGQTVPKCSFYHLISASQTVLITNRLYDIQPTVSWISEASWRDFWKNKNYDFNCGAMCILFAWSSTNCQIKCDERFTTCTRCVQNGPTEHLNQNLVNDKLI